MVENKEIELCNELGQNFIDFSYEANSARAFADARDGLKPGQRACLWEMFDKGYLSSKPHVKSAKISGGVIGAWWPHGDTAIYETFARMSQPWINNIPEVSWHGNNGSQYSGPECASSRYTEARLSKIAEEGLFNGIKKKNVNMIMNFSEDAEWPEVLPAILPRLLVNGCQGIGSTIANVWLPFPLKEVSETIIKYMTTGELDYSNLYPSFPTGGMIINKNDIHLIHETGKGKVILRGKAEIKENKILITELPYQIYAQPYVEKITDMAIKDELTGIEAVYNKSGKNKLLIEIECDGNPNQVLNQLYSKTDLQKNYNANQWALVGKTPKLLTLKDYCDIYIKHNLECLCKELKFDLNKAKTRLNIINGLLIALEDIDNIITLIKSSESAAAAKNNLILKYKLNEEQAKAILDMKLAKLAKLEKIALEEEKEELNAEIDMLGDILTHRDQQIQQIRDRLITIVQKYGDNRKTELTQIEVTKEDKEIEAVTPEDVVVIVNQNGNIKRIPSKSFKVQRKGGKGIKSQEDAILDTISTNTVDNLMIFTDKGKMYKLLIDNIPAGTNSSKGVNISSLIKIDNDERVIAVNSLSRKATEKYVVFITKKGLVKKTLLDEYKTIKKSTGIQAIKLNEEDSIVNVNFMNEENLIIITKQGMSIRFETENIAAIGRVTAGVKSIKLSDNDYVLVGLPIKNNSDEIGIFTSKGIAKKTLLEELPIQGRAGKGIHIYKPTEDTGELIGAIMLNKDDNILLIGKPNSICVSSNDIPSLTRGGVGNIIIKNSIIQKIVKI